MHTEVAYIGDRNDVEGIARLKVLDRMGWKHYPSEPDYHETVEIPEEDYGMWPVIDYGINF